MTRGFDSCLLLIREILARELSEDLAVTILFEAFDELEAGAPERIEDLGPFVDGPLWKHLDRRLPAELATSLHRRIGRLLDEGDHAAWEEETGKTRRLPQVREAVPVLVAAIGGRFARVLETALGPAAEVERVRDVAALAARLEAGTPFFVVVDGHEPPAGGAEETATALRALAPSGTPVLWACETPHGRRLAPIVEERVGRLVTLDSRDGVSSLFDLILSRLR